MTYSPPTVPAPKAGRNTLGIVALATALMGAIFVMVEGAYIIGWVLLPISFVLSLVALVQRDKAKKAAIAALILSIIGPVIGAVAFLGSVSRAIDASANRGTTTVAPSGGGGATAAGEDAQRTIELRVTTQRAAQVHWTTGGGTSSEEITEDWSQTLQTDQSFEYVSLWISNADYRRSNTVTCEILVNGVSVSKQSGSGMSASASCSASV